jgi:phage tail sheath gpL-like
MISPSAASRVCGVDVEYKNFNNGNAAMLPQRLAVFGVGNDGADYGLEKYEGGGSASAVGDRYGYGSPLHLMAKIFFPPAGAAATFPVTFFPLKPPGNATAAEGSITVTGTATANGSGTVYIGGVRVEFAVTKGQTLAGIRLAVKEAINGNMDVPAMADINSETDVIELTSKWSGESSNLISLEMEGNFPGLTFSTVGFAGGALDPDITPALQKIGNVWETQILDSFDYKKLPRLDQYQEFGEARWGSLEKKPLLVAHGCTDTLAVRGAITDPRKPDYINYLIVSVGSRELPFVIAAKGLVNDIMTTANNNPAHGYKGLLTSLHCGDDSVQENYSQRDLSVKKGSSTNIKNGSVAELNDIITFWHPESEGTFPSRRYVVALVKLQNIVFNVRLIMEDNALKGAPLIADTQPTRNRAAQSPKMIRASLMNLANSLAEEAILAEAEFTKKNLSVKLDTANPNRLNNTFPVKLSGNIEITDSLIQFGFLLGGE